VTLVSITPIVKLLEKSLAKAGVKQFVLVKRPLAKLLFYKPV